MSGIKDGGPAFPLLNPAIGYHADIRQAANGLSLRDYFAAKAMTLIDDDAGLSYVCQVLGVDRKDYVWQEHWPLYVAKQAYAYADAMIKARGTV